MGTSQETERVRAHTHPEANARIDRLTQERIRAAAAHPEANETLARLDREWDFERVLETEAALTGLVGLTLGIALDRRFLALTAFATAMVFVHAAQGWYPLLPLLRRMAVRTDDEIARERYALKALRGDFAGVSSLDHDRRAEAAWRAVQL